MTKTMVVSYNPITGIPLGRCEKGDAIIHSGDYGRKKYLGLLFTAEEYGAVDEADMSDEVLITIDATGVSIVREITGDSQINHIKKMGIVDKAEAELLRLKTAMQDDVGQVDIVYIYVGASAMDGAMALIKDLKQLEKKVFMVACSCSAETKHIFAEELGVDWIRSECGGEDTLAEIIEKLSTK